MVSGRVNQESFFTAVVEGVKSGLFGYAEALEGAVLRGPESDLKADEVRFSGWLIGEDVPLPVTTEELRHLLPAEGRVALQDLYQRAVDTYGDERITTERLLDLLNRGVGEKRFGYAATVEAPIQPGVQIVSLDGYVGLPDVVPPDTRLIRVRGEVSSAELANVVRAAMQVSGLGAQVEITLDLTLALEGEVKNEHSLQMALRELRQRVAGLRVEDVGGSD
jgi:hypothetical protein